MESVDIMEQQTMTENNVQVQRRRVSFLWGEGLTDMVVGRRLLQRLGVMDPHCHVAQTGGCGVFWKLAPTMNRLATSGRLVLGLTDLDDAPSPAELVRAHFPHGYSPNYLLRVPVIMLEAWLLADREAFADYLEIDADLMPADPEAIRMPKITIVELARRSHNWETRTDIAPPPTSHARVGRGYTRHLLNFTQTAWDPLRAAERSPSLTRTIVAIERACCAIAHD